MLPGRADPGQGSPAARLASTLLSHSELSKEKRSWWGLVFFSCFFIYLFILFLIAKREGYFKKKTSLADTWGGTFQIPLSPSMLDEIIIKVGGGGMGDRTPDDAI